MVHEKNIVKLASALIHLANAKGGRDNIGVILIHAKAAPDKPGKLSAFACRLVKDIRLQELFVPNITI